MEIKRNGNTVEFEIEIGHDELEKAMNDAYMRERKHFSLPGFRKGRVPRQLLEANYGSGLFFEDAINDVLPQRYSEIVEEENLKVVSEPNIDLKGDYEKGKPTVLTVEVDVLPEFDVEDYEGLEIDKVIPEVKDEMVDARIESERQKHGRMSIIEDRAVEEGDQVVIDFTGFVDDEEFEGGSAEDYELTIGSGAFIPGFEDQLIGKEIDEEVEVEVTFPQEYQAEELAGKDANFDVVIKEIRQIDLPEVDDDFVMDISDFDTVDEYRADIKENLENQMEDESKRAMRSQVIIMLADLVDIEIPDSLVERQIDTEINNFANQFASQGMDPSMFEGMFEDPEMRENFREQAEVNVKNSLVLERLAEQLEIEVSDDEFEEKLKEIADMYMGAGDSDMKDEFIKDSLENKPEPMMDDFIIEKTIDHVIEKAKINEISVEEAEEKAKREAEEAENTEE